MRAGVKPQDIFPYPIDTVYSRLAELGVRSSVHQDAAFTPSPHGAIAFKGADVVPFANFREGLSAMSERILAGREPSYHFLYFSGIDNVGHQYGPNSPLFDVEVDTTLQSYRTLPHETAEKQPWQNPLPDDSRPRPDRNQP